MEIRGVEVRWRPPIVASWAVWLALAIQILVYIGTAFWWGPGQSSLSHALLADGSLDKTYVLLLNTQWIRVALITAAGVLELWMAFKSFITIKPN